MDAYPLLMIALYPLLSITLRNNLAVLFSNLGTSFGPVFRQRCFTLAAALPMLLFAFANPDIAHVTSITGAYFGCGIMYIIPAILVTTARRTLQEEFPEVVANPHRSEFQGGAYIVLL